MHPYQHETTLVHNALPVDSVARRENHNGMMRNEPIIIMLDSLLRYARAYRKRFEHNVADETALKEYFVGALTGVRGMLSWQGAVANELGHSRDSKDNGAMDQLFFLVTKEAGLTEEDLNL